MGLRTSFNLTKSELRKVERQLGPRRFDYTTFCSSHDHPCITLSRRAAKEIAQAVGFSGQFPSGDHYEMTVRSHCCATEITLSVSKKEDIKTFRARRAILTKIALDEKARAAEQKRQQACAKKPCKTDKNNKTAGSVKSRKANRARRGK